MIFKSSLTVGITTLLSIISGGGTSQTPPKTPAFFLAGDSTTAVQAVKNGGGKKEHPLQHTIQHTIQQLTQNVGWGTGFLNTALQGNATGTNFGHNGATTASFRAGGDWAACLSAAALAVPKYTPYVTIQFGHNDQKPEKNISMAQLTANLEAFVAEARAVHAVPILVTSLSRRRFANATMPPRVVENLADVTAAAKEAARRTGAYVVDLNKASTRYLNSIGPEKAARFNQDPTDFTHLNSEGSVVFGNMLAMLIKEEVPELSRWVVPVKKIERAIKKGRFILPEA